MLLLLSLAIIAYQIRQDDGGNEGDKGIAGSPSFGIWPSLVVGMSCFNRLVVAVPFAGQAGKLQMNRRASKGIDVPEFVAHLPRCSFYVVYALILLLLLFNVAASFFAILLLVFVG